MDKRQAPFILADWVRAHSGTTFGPSLPQQEVISLLSELHSFHAGRSGWANEDFTHEQIRLRVGEALDRALVFAAEAVEDHALVA